ncbi:MAG: hypothetical protein HQL99_07510 [Magnetococcales bacterium]|nr:hypothetical protein [Magnetococcales bacterium]
MNQQHGGRDRKRSGLLLLACLLVTGCSKSEEKQKTDPRETAAASQQTAAVASPALQASSPQQPSRPPQSGKVVEVKQAGAHTYVKIEADGLHHWLATNPAKPKPGEVVHWDRFSMKQNYYSKALNQTFPTILLVGTLQPGPAPAAVTPSKGKAHAVLNAGGYTYVQIGNANGIWLAGPTARIKEGDTVIWAQGTPMKNFTNKTLNRTFDDIIFLGRLQSESPSGSSQPGATTAPEAAQTPPVKPQRPLQRATTARETPTAAQPPQTRRNTEAGAPKTPPPPVRQPPHRPEPPKPPAPEPPKPPAR